MIRLKSLGECAVEVGPTRLGPESQIVFATMLYLLLERGKRVSRHVLIENLWPDVIERRAQHCLRQTLYKLRTLGARIENGGPDIRIETKHAELDFAAFIEGAEHGKLDSLNQPVVGSFLPGYSPSFSQQFGEWLERHRDAVHASLRRVLVAGIIARKARGDWRSVETLAASCFAIDPLNEEATLAMAEAAAVHGSKSRALGILDRYLKEIGPQPREIRIPATILRKRISEASPGGGLGFVPIGEVPFVGRSAEMETLNASFDAARSGAGSSRLYWGEAGIGKTRLIGEFSKSASLHRAQVVRVGCQSHDVRRPLSIFVDIVPKLLTLPGAIGCSPESMGFLRRLVEHDPRVTTTSEDAREAELLFGNVRRSVFDLLDAVTSETCVVMVLEDVHWLDAASWELLRDVVPWVATRSALLLLTARDSGESGAPKVSSEIRSLSVQRLGNLSDSASGEIVTSIAAQSGRNANDGFRQWCVTRGGGNPYYVSELAMRSMASGNTYTVPQSLRALITERLSRLRPSSLRVLQASAVLGKHASFDRLEAVLDQNRIELLDSFDELEAHALIDCQGSLVQLKHELLSQAALDRLSGSSLRLLHRHAAKTLESAMDGSQSASVMWDCAEHWQHAGELTRAIELLRSCARHSMEMGMPGEAAETLRRALDMAPDKADALVLTEERGLALCSAATWAEAVIDLERVISSRSEDGTNDGHDELELRLHEARWRSGANLPVQFAALRSCVESAGASSSHKVSAATIAMMIADNLCDTATPHEIYRVARPQTDNPSVEDPVRLLFYMVYNSSVGDQDFAAGYARELLSVERKRGNPAILARSLAYAGHVLRFAGLIAESQAIMEEAYYLARRHELLILASNAGRMLSQVHMNARDLASARLWSERAHPWPSSTSSPVTLSAVLGSAAELALLEGRYTEAYELRDRSSAATSAGMHIRSRAYLLALKVLLDIAARHFPPSEAELADLIGLHLRTRDTNDQDTVAVAVLKGCDAVGQRERGHQLILDYLFTHRRQRDPPMPELLKVCSPAETAKLKNAEDKPKLKMTEPNCSYLT